MRFVLSFIKVLKMSRLFRQDQDQDQDFYFKTKTKTKTIFHVLEAPRDQDQGLETTSLVVVVVDACENTVILHCMCQYLLINFIIANN